VLEDKANNIAASDDVPSWALSSLGLTSLTCGQKEQLMVAAATGGRWQTLWLADPMVGNDRWLGHHAG
jgi:hypothetical protein